MANEPRVRVELLGPVRVVRTDATAPVKGRLPSMALCLLAVRPGAVLSADSLIARAWSGRPPASAASALRVHVATVRQLVSVAGADGLPRGRRGYHIDPDLVRTDLQDFDELVGELAAQPPLDDVQGLSDRSRPLAEAATERLRTIDAALALVRGAPFGGLADEDTELSIEAARIAQVVETLEEDRVAGQLALGQHAQACAAAAGLVTGEPLRERRTRLLMLALYQAGRQADALTAFRRLREALLDELGTDPEPATRALELAILRQDSGLLLPPAVPLPPGALDRPRAADAAMPVPGATDPRETLVATLSPPARTLVEIVAVLDDMARPAVVEAALEAAIGVGAETATDAAASAGAAAERAIAAAAFERSCAEGRAAGTLAGGIPGGILRLSPPELRESLLRAMTPERRDGLHVAAGRALAASAERDPHLLVPAAWHLALATRTQAGRLGPEDELVVVRVVQQCLATGQAEAAERLASQTLESPAAASPTRVDLMTARVRALTMLGRTQDATDEWQRAVAAAREVGDPARLALATLARDWAIRSAQSPEDGEELLREASQALGPGLSAVRVRVLSALLLELSTFRLSSPELPGLAAEVERDASILGDAESICALHHVQHVLLRSGPDLDTRRRRAAQLARAAAATGNPWWRARALAAQLSDCFAAGDYAALPELILRFKEAALESRTPRLTWHHSLIQSSFARERGDFAEADRYANEAMMQGAAAFLPDTLGAVVLHRMIVALHRENLVASLPQFVHFRTMQPDNPLAYACLSLSMAQAGDLDGARAPFARALALLDGGLTEIGVLSLGVTVEAAVTLAAHGEAAGIRGLLAPFDGLFLTFGQVIGTLGPAGRYLGLLTWLEGDAAGALQRIETAQEAARRAGALVWEIRCAADRVAILCATGAEDEARSLRNQYAAQADSLGLGPCSSIFARVEPA